MTVKMYGRGNVWRFAFGGLRFAFGGLRLAVGTAMRTALKLSDFVDN